MSSRRFDQLLLDLYSCPDEASRWHGVLDQVCQATGAGSAIVQLLVKGSDRLCTKWIVGDSQAAASRARPEPSLDDEDNPRLELARRRLLKPGMQILRDRDLFAPGDPKLTRLWEQSATFGLGRFLSVGVPLPDEGRLALVLHRDVDDRADFDDHEVSFAQRLLPHVHRTVQLVQRLDASERRAMDLEQAVNQLRCAFVLCSPDARVLWANQAAQQIFARRERLWVNGERLTTSSLHETAALRQRIADVARQEDRRLSPSSQLLVLGLHSASATVQVMLRPVQASAVLLILAEPGNPATLPAEFFEAAFELTPAESRLAAAISGGMLLNDYAAAQGVSVETARSQLKQVLAKTRSHRQSDLVRQVFSSVMAFALAADDP